jgi:hypothetical protein
VVVRGFSIAFGPLNLSLFDLPGLLLGLVVKPSRSSQIPALEVGKGCDQIVSFIQEEWTPIYTFQFARHFAHATPLLVRSREIRTNEVQGITSAGV